MAIRGLSRHNTIKIAPDELKETRVTPLYRKIYKVGNYRPISVLTTDSTILNKSIILILISIWFSMFSA